MRIAWIGFHQEGLTAFEAVLDAGYDVRGAFTLTDTAASGRSGAADYAPLCRRYEVPLTRVDDMNNDESVAGLATLRPDVVVVLGWTQLLRRRLLKVAQIGFVGAHASLLPRNRGHSPVNWAIIRGETSGGNTLMWLDDGVDSGDIIDQIAFPITPYDTCATVYDVVADSNREMVLGLLRKLEQGERPGTPQPHCPDPPLPARSPADGQIDWTAPAKSVYDLVRGVTRPYPGAFSHVAGDRWRVWRCALMPADSAVGAPGKVVGMTVSPDARACGAVVACGRGAVVLLEIENDAGTVLSGRTLAEMDWIGLAWSHD